MCISVWVVPYAETNSLCAYVTVLDAVALVRIHSSTTRGGMDPAAQLHACIVAYSYFRRLRIVTGTTRALCEAAHAYFWVGQYAEARSLYRRAVIQSRISAEEQQHTVQGTALVSDLAKYLACLSIVECGTR